MTDELKLFTVGEKITANDTNDNNRYLENLASDTAGTLQAYIDSELSTISNTLTNSITSLSNSVVKLSGTQTITGKKTFSVAAYGTASSAINSILTTLDRAGLGTQNGFVKLGNGLIIQWLKFTQNANSQEHTWKTNFTSGTTYVTVLTGIASVRTGVNIMVTSQSASKFTCYAEDNERANGLYAIAIGT